MHSQLTRLNRTTEILEPILMFTVIALAFLVSFENIRTFAEGTKAVSPRLSWCIPLLVDVPIIAGSIAWLNCSLAAERARPAQAVVAMGALASLGLNLAHSPHYPGAYAVAITPPAALIVIVELAMWNLRRRVRRTKPQVTEEGPGVALPLLPDVDWETAVKALQRAAEDPSGEGLSGRTLARAYAALGYRLSDREGRSVLRFLRPEPGDATDVGPDGAAPGPEHAANGHGPGREVELAHPE
jgi:hypothetical protein